MFEKKLEEKIIEAIKKAEIEIPKDVISSLEKAKAREKGIAKTQLEAILENIKISLGERIPVCQDTGVMNFYIEAGSNFKYFSELRNSIKEAVKKATKEIPLRPNAVNPFTGENSGDNTGRNLPYIIWDIKEGDECKINFMPKGGGSENMSVLRMLNPEGGIFEAKKFILEHIINIGGKPCPPTILGVGIGGGAEVCLCLAKKALFRKIGERHPEERIAKMEEELIELINKSGVGPMGLGGKTTVLDVHIEYAYRHPGSFPLGIVIQCWANRRSSVRIKNDGSIEVI
ncbi:MAG: fumarate hydratase [candidate division WOR-3 bacterium]